MQSSIHLCKRLLLGPKNRYLKLIILFLFYAWEDINRIWDHYIFFFLETNTSIYEASLSKAQSTLFFILNLSLSGCNVSRWLQGLELILIELDDEQHFVFLCLHGRGWNTNERLKQNIVSDIIEIITGFYASWSLEKSQTLPGCKGSGGLEV